MICEPNLSLPQKIDIESFKKTELANESSKVSHEQKPFLYEEEEYKILPKLTGQFDFLDPILSLRNNHYLACRWNQFLDNVPDEYIHIHLYKDYNKHNTKLIVKPKTLNGQFYGVDNKLAPIPVMPDRTKLQRNKTCEPFKGSAQNITIESLRGETYTSKATALDPNGRGIGDAKHEGVKISTFDNNYEYNVLPLYHDEYTVYNRFLSLRENEYLKLRWDEFLKNPPKDYVRIQLRAIKTEKQQPRRKTLNGRAYDWNNKLAPIPNDHPDNLIRKHLHICDRSFRNKEDTWTNCKPVGRASAFYGENSYKWFKTYKELK